jgi:hypothetical protein
MRTFASLLSAVVTVMLALPAGVSCSSAQTAAGVLQGQVLDPSGAAILRATVTITSESGAVKKAETDGQGLYRVDELSPGTYTVRVGSPGFAQFERTNFEISAGRSHTLGVQLQIQWETQNITVSETAQVEVDPSQNASQIALKGNDLDVLSDDTDDLAKDLQALAGPAAGPDGPQIYIDGFTDGRLPPKESIREVRVNQNPFSAEFYRVGFGVSRFSLSPARQVSWPGLFRLYEPGTDCPLPVSYEPRGAGLPAGTFWRQFQWAIVEKKQLFPGHRASRHRRQYVAELYLP